MSASPRAPRSSVGAEPAGARLWFRRRRQRRRRDGESAAGATGDADFGARARCHRRQSRLEHDRDRRAGWRRTDRVRSDPGRGGEMRMPALAVGIGIYLPMSATFAVVVGALIATWYDGVAGVGELRSGRTPGDAGRLRSHRRREPVWRPQCRPDRRVQHRCADGAGWTGRLRRGSSAGGARVCVATIVALYSWLVRRAVPSRR